MSRAAIRRATTRVAPFWHFLPDDGGWVRQSRSRRVRVRDRDDTTPTFPLPGPGRTPVEWCDACLGRQEHSRGYHAAAVRRAAASRARRPSGQGFHDVADVIQEDHRISTPPSPV